MRKKEITTAIVSDVYGNLPALEAVLALARKCNYEREHTHQVEKLALQLFDQLVELHHLSGQERFMLRCGALLHDIGWIEGKQGHHKTALRIIMENAALPFNFRDKNIIALLARYHHKALPKERHSYFRDLDTKDQNIVRLLSGILRVADGLDRTHQSKVGDISCQVDKKQVEMVCRSAVPLDAEFAAAADKGMLFEQVFNRKLVFERQACR
jgi:exopolyphosphatase/pppGpp-phosphohydrolase